MHKIDVFEKAALLCGYQLIYVKYGNHRHVLFAEGYIPNIEGRFSGILADYATERKAESVWKYTICRFRQL